MVDILQLADGPGLGLHLGVVIAMVTIIVLVAFQFWETRGHPRDRAALTWLGLAVVIGAGAFVATVIIPNLLGIDALISQGEAFLFFLLIYVGLALGVARFRLFQLDEWAFRILFYTAGVLLLIALDALLIFTIVDERAPAFALSLLIVALAWLPLRDMLSRLMLRRKEPERASLFRQVMDVALTPPGEDQQARWQDLLVGTFNPLSIERRSDLSAPALANDGIALEVPGVGALCGMRLDYADGGRKLFSLRDLDLAGELVAMLANALESREAYEKGVAEERRRIARDIHDNIGVQLMGALHNSDRDRKDMMIRETLTDLRDIVNNASRPDLSFDEMLADLRAQISEHLFAAGIEMQWTSESEETAVLLIVEDLSETRRWLVEIARAAFPGCTISEAVSMRAGITQAVTTAFDIALIDLGLPDGSGLEVLREMRLRQSEAICVVTTVMGDDASIVGALSAGAQGYLLKEQPTDLLTRQLKQTAQGVPALSPSVARRIMEHFSRTGPAAPEDDLTARERDVLFLIGRGLRNGEAATALGLSENTVASYIKTIYRKLGISSRAEASWHAARMGLSEKM